MPCPVTANGKARDDDPHLWGALADSSSRSAAAASPAVGAWLETEVPVGKLQADALLEKQPAVCTWLCGLCLTAAAAALDALRVPKICGALTWPSRVSAPPASWRFCCSLTLGLRTCL